MIHKLIGVRSFIMIEKVSALIKKQKYKQLSRYNANNETKTILNLLILQFVVKTNDIHA